MSLGKKSSPRNKKVAIHLSCSFLNIFMELRIYNPPEFLGRFGVLSAALEASLLFHVVLVAAHVVVGYVADHVAVGLTIFCIGTTKKNTMKHHSFCLSYVAMLVYKKS